MGWPWRNSPVPSSKSIGKLLQVPAHRDYWKTLIAKELTNGENYADIQPTARFPKDPSGPGSRYLIVKEPVAPQAVSDLADIDLVVFLLGCTIALSISG